MEHKKGYSTSVVQSIVNDFERFIIDNGNVDYRGMYLKDGDVFAVIEGLTKEHESVILDKYEEYRTVAITRPKFCRSVPEGGESNLSKQLVEQSKSSRLSIYLS